MTAPGRPDISSRVKATAAAGVGVILAVVLIRFAVIAFAIMLAAGILAANGIIGGTLSFGESLALSGLATLASLKLSAVS